MSQLELIHKSINNETFSETEAYSIMQYIMKGEVSEILLSALLTSIKMRGVKKEELLGFVKAMRDASLKPDTSFHFSFLDTCGTGGDGKGTVNISTLTALNLASLEIKVAKHGNRSVSSVSGSSDILSEFGYNVQMSMQDSIKQLQDKHFCFLFAPMYHPSMKYAVEVRKQLATRTIFNMLGPLCNPFSPDYQIMGVYSKDLFENISYVLSNLVKVGIVCHSKDGLDEFSIFSDTDYIFIKNKEWEERVFKIDNLGLKNLKPEELYCKTKEDAKKLFQSVLNKEDIAASHSVALNTGAALFAYGNFQSIEAGYESALKNILTGKLGKYFQSLLS